MKRMEIMRLEKAIGYVDLPDRDIGETLPFTLPDGTTLILSVSRPHKGHARTIRAGLTKLETLRLIPGFKEYGNGR